MPRLSETEKAQRSAARAIQLLESTLNIEADTPASPPGLSEAPAGSLCTSPAEEDRTNEPNEPEEDAEVDEIGKRFYHELEPGEFSSINQMLGGIVSASF